MCRCACSLSVLALPLPHVFVLFCCLSEITSQNCHSLEPELQPSRCSTSALNYRTAVSFPAISALRCATSITLQSGRKSWVGVVAGLRDGQTEKRGSLLGRDNIFVPFETFRHGLGPMQCSGRVRQLTIALHFEVQNFGALPSRICSWRSA
jgi:hypothetical protein